MTDCNVLPPKSAQEQQGRKNSHKRRVRSLFLRMVFNDRRVYKDRHERISSWPHPGLILARRDNLHPKAEYICADLSSRTKLPLAVARRTIHSRYLPRLTGKLTPKENGRRFDLSGRNVPVSLQELVFLICWNRFKTVLLVEANSPTRIGPGSDENWTVCQSL
jgi:hypothetical protein